MEIKWKTWRIQVLRRLETALWKLWLKMDVMKGRAKKEAKKWIKENVPLEGDDIMWGKAPEVENEKKKLKKSVGARIDKYCVNRRENVR